MLKSFLFFISLVVFISSKVTADEYRNEKEDLVKSALLLNIARFIQWPDDSFNLNKNLFAHLNKNLLSLLILF